MPFFTIVVTTIYIEGITFRRLALMRLSVASAIARAVIIAINTAIPRLAFVKIALGLAKLPLLTIFLLFTVNTAIKTVSYTHLTLPTICSV